MSFKLILTEMHRLWKDEDGAAALEYGLIAAGIAVAIATIVTPIGTQLRVTFNSILTALGGAAVT
ncbi:Flp family type IVb pilin [Roseomonas sp. 18066]|uniref:Flp family type IVb pilin n=1 Tax=Roseomonas sp. 18066 TaxID=2681412 RepID=UPI001F310E8E|nr:Flp family type IVb pilin [Roseomonas sp. 18066]